MTRTYSHTLASLLHVRLQRSSSLGICWVRRELCSRGPASGEEKWIQASASCWLHPETARGRETAFSSSLESSYLNSGQKVLLEYWGVGARGRDDGNKPHFRFPFSLQQPEWMVESFTAIVIESLCLNCHPLTHLRLTVLVLSDLGFCDLQSHPLSISS